MYDSIVFAIVEVFTSPLIWFVCLFIVCLFQVRPAWWLPTTPTTAWTATATWLAAVLPRTTSSRPPRPPTSSCPRRWWPRPPPPPPRAPPRGKSSIAPRKIFQQRPRGRARVPRGHLWGHIRKEVSSINSSISHFFLSSLWKPQFSHQNFSFLLSWKILIVFSFLSFTLAHFSETPFTRVTFYCQKIVF